MSKIGNALCIISQVNRFGTRGKVSTSIEEEVTAEATCSPLQHSKSVENSADYKACSLEKKEDPL